MKNIKSKIVISILLATSIALLFSSFQFLYASMDIADFIIDPNKISPENQRLLNIYNIGFLTCLISSPCIFIGLLIWLLKKSKNKQLSN